MTKLKGERYRIQKTIRQGGCGVTYLAVDTQEKIPCVVKQFKPNPSNPPSVHPLILDKFKNEAKVLKELSNKVKQIPELYDDFQEDGEYYLVQEYIEGKTLIERVDEEGTFDEREAKDFLLNFLNIVIEIHRRGHLHRDIHPGNIILRKVNNEPVLIDFGAVKQIVTGAINRSGKADLSTIIGVRGYRPPEQEDNANYPISASSDLYSLGITLIFLLTGKQAWTLLRDNSGYLQWQNFCLDVSKAFAEYLNKAVDLIPSRRYQSAEEMLRELEELTEVRLSKDSTEDDRSGYKRKPIEPDGIKNVLNGLSPGTQPSGKTQLVRSAGSAYKTLIFFIGVLFVAIVILLFFAFTYIFQGRQETKNSSESQQVEHEPAGLSNKNVSRAKNESQSRTQNSNVYNNIQVAEKRDVCYKFSPLHLSSPRTLYRAIYSATEQFRDDLIPCYEKKPIQWVLSKV